MRENIEAQAKYLKELTAMDDKELIKEFLSYLDYTEESDSGREFHPIHISSVRCMMQQPLEMVLNQMRRRVL